MVKSIQSTSFDHTIFNVNDVQDNHTILYFENLNLNGNLINGLGAPVHLDSATNKQYVDTTNSMQDIAIADKASKSYVDNEIAKIPQNVLLLDGSKAMTGSLNMNDHPVIGIRSSAVDDAALTVGGAKATYFPLLGNRSMQGNLNMGGFAITNIKPFVEDDSSQAASDAQKNQVINFGYFHTERGYLKRLINEVGYDALNRKNPDPMEDNIDMANHSITNLKEPQPSDVSHAASVNYVTGAIVNNNFIIIGTINDKIKELEEKTIQAVNQENVFEK